MGLIDSPLKRTADTVYLLGSSRVSRALVDWTEIMRGEAEVWCLNEQYRFRPKFVDMDIVAERGRWFQLHPMFDWGRFNNINDPNHKYWLLNVSGECRHCHGAGCKECDRGIYTPVDRPLSMPIYMLEEVIEVPGSVRYPAMEIWDQYGPNLRNARWHQSSFSYMMAMAIHLGFGTIKIRGWEMRSDTEWGEQKPNAMMWAGIAIGKGIIIDQPEGNTLFGNKPLYGYDKLPEFTTMHAEILHKGYLKEFQDQMAEVNVLLGREGQINERLQKARDPKEKRLLADELQKAFQDRINAMMRANTTSGAAQATKKVLNQLRSLPDPGDIKPVDLNSVTPAHIRESEMPDIPDDAKHNLTPDDLLPEGVANADMKQAEGKIFLNPKQPTLAEAGIKGKRNRGKKR